MRITIEGDEKFRQFLKTRPKVALHAMAGAAFVEAEQIMKRSKDEFVPHDLGALQASGEVDPTPETTRTGVTITLGYGGPAAAYALAIHEHPESPPSPAVWRGKNIKWSKPGTGPKYLEKPMLEAEKGMAERIGSRIGRRLEKL